MSNTPPPSLTMAAGGLGAPSGQHAPLPSLPSLPSLSSLSANQGWSTTVLSAAARPLAPSRPMSALELELWCAPSCCAHGPSIAYKLPTSEPALPMPAGSCSFSSCW